MMRDIIITSCNHILSNLNDKTSKDVFFNNCVQEKLTKMYSVADSEYDTILHKLEIGIDYNDYTQVKKCVVKIMRLMTKNRKALLDTLERLG